MNGSTECFSVPIRDDMAFEKDENFGLKIDSTEENVVPHTESISVTIHDDDSECGYLHGSGILSGIK